MKPILVFDVNETLLDLKALDPLFKEIFGDVSVRQQWFNQFIHNAFLSVITDSYKPFGEIGLSALEMIAERKNTKINSIDKMRIMTGIKNLPPHDEVPKALKQLKEAGYRMVTLTNSTQEVALIQIQNAGLSEYFERIFSADSVKMLKPAKKPYGFVAKDLNVEMKDLMLIASHAWDIAGAMKSGYKAAFIARPGAVLDPLMPKPDIDGKDLHEVAQKIIRYKEIFPTLIVE
jgi:2-haloacid dehalogenase